MIRRPPTSTLSSSSAASDVYKRQPPILTRFVKSLCLARFLGIQRATKWLRVYNERKYHPGKVAQRSALEFSMKSRPLAVATAMLLSVILALPSFAQDTTQTQAPSAQSPSNSQDQPQPAADTGANPT